MVNERHVIPLAPSSSSGSSGKKRKSNSTGASSGGNSATPSTTSTSKDVAPIFLRKTYHLITTSDPEVACWADDGKSFIVKDQQKFAQVCIPQCFNHNNFSSFVRQLNFYGFRKLRDDPLFSNHHNSSSGDGKNENHKKYSQFYHPKFLRGHPEMLSEIKKPNHMEYADKREVESLRNEVGSLTSTIQSLKGEMKVLLDLVGDLKSELVEAKRQQVVAAANVAANARNRGNIVDIYFTPDAVSSTPHTITPTASSSTNNSKTTSPPGSSSASVQKESVPVETSVLAADDIVYQPSSKKIKTSPSSSAFLDSTKITVTPTAVPSSAVHVLSPTTENAPPQPVLIGSTSSPTPSTSSAASYDAFRTMSDDFLSSDDISPKEQEILDALFLEEGFDIDVTPEAVEALSQ